MQSSDPLPAAGIQRRRLLAGGLLATAAAALPGAARSGAYPDKPVIVRVAFPAGGPADAAIRTAIVVLQRTLGVVLVAENMPGANGSIGAMTVLRSPADGYTLLGTTGNDFLLAPQTIASAKYDPEAFGLLGVVGISDFILVSSPDHRFDGAGALVAAVKKGGSTPLSIAHWGPGSMPHIACADFEQRAGIRLVEVPYKGAAPTFADVAGGHVDLTFAPLGGPVLGMIQGGKLRPIAIASASRNPALPDVPTFAESASMPHFEHAVWSALLAPPGTPDGVRARLLAAMNVWIDSPENAERIAQNASRKLPPMTTVEAAAFLKAEHDKLVRIARSLNLQPQ